MIEIDEPPDIKACGACARPLTWLWSARKRGWVAFATSSNDIDLIRVHRCRQPDLRRSWRYTEAVPESVRRRGASRARAVLAASARKDKP